MPLKQLLTDRRDDILARFVRDVEREDLSPRGLARSVLVDQLPLFLQDIASDLPHPGTDLPEVTARARRHGGERWKSGYDLEAVVREYGVLRHAIVEAASAAGAPLSVDELDTLATYLNIGAVGAAAEYVRSREEQLTARQAELEFLIEAGELLGSSLDYQSTLGRVTRLLVPRFADFCVVQLNDKSIDDMPIAHVIPEKAALIRDALRHFPVPDGVHNHSEVLRTGKPLIIEKTPDGFLERVAKTPEHLALLRQIAPRSWLVVPLQIKNTTFGSITLGWSESDRQYDRSDLLLASELARRAASAIDNAQLYELSRAERARAEAATRTKDEFVAVVSHELRTPLNVIIGWVRLLRSGSLPDQTRDHALEVVERNANAQSQLVADLLDISRVLTGRVRLEPAQVDLASLTTLVIEDARLALEAKRLQIHTNIEGEATLMRGDAERLKQVVWNLLLNAIKFTPKGGQVWVRLRRIESDLELTVTDSGTGIAPEFLPYIFDSFRQFDSKTTRTHGGLGIGLSITKHLVDLHGGSLEARSEGLGKGAAFVVRLPLSPVISTTLGVSKVPATSPRGQRLTRPAALAGMRVLVVDDEDDARELLRIILESCDVTVHDAGSASEALTILEQEIVDVIISDIGMPEQDGYSLIRSVRALGEKEKASVPAIALTAFTRTEDRARALLEGFNMHMAKPVEPAELLVALTDLRGVGLGRAE